MGASKENKRRREERIRSLLDRPPEAYGRPPAGTVADNRRTEPAEPGKTTAGQGIRAAEPDPEIEWKRKSREWLHAVHGGEREGTRDDEYPSGRMPGSGRQSTGFLRRLVLSAVLFGAVWGLFRLDMPWAEPARAFVIAALTEEMDTAAVAAWYRDTFAGAPSFIPSFGTAGTESRSVDGTVRLPVVAPVPGGSVVRSFAETLNGVEIYGAADSAVRAMETGRVSRVSADGAGGVRVVIRHADKVESIYGKLFEATVQEGDWVEAGDRIGTLGREKDGAFGLLFFSVQVDGKVVDPTDVVPLD